MQPLEIKFKKEADFDFYNNKRMTFFIVTKNRAGFLVSALARAKNLIGPEDELLIIDGASSDNTFEAVNRYKEFIDVFVSEPDKNGLEAYNKGILLARGKYMHHIADDDTSYKEGIEKAIAVLENNPEVDMLVCGGIREYGPRLLPYWLPPGTNYGSRPEDVFRYKACGAGFVYRRKAFAKFGLFHSVAGDIDFVARIIFHGGSVRFCRINLFKHPLFAHSVIKSKKRAHQLARWLIAWRYCSFGFSLRYIVVSAIKESVLWHFYRKTARIFKVRILGKPYKRKKKNIEYIWDGGFS